MENKEFDATLRQSLRPMDQPAESLDQAILEKLQALPAERNVGKRNAWNVLPKVAAVVLAVAVLGTGTVFAAGKIFDKINVLNHGISVGNQDYVNDEDLAAPWESASVEEKGEEAPGPDDKWTRKRSELVSGIYHNDFYYYDKYEDAIADSRFESLFTEIPGEEQSVVYCVTDGGDIMEYSIDSIFEYESGIVSASQSVMEGNVAEDASYSIIMKQTGNARTYISKSGLEFSLVDDLGAGEDGLSTIVMIAYDNIRGYIGFRGLTEEQIQQVLDLVTY